MGKNQRFFGSKHQPKPRKKSKMSYEGGWAIVAYMQDQCPKVASMGHQVRRNGDEWVLLNFKECEG